LPANDRDPAGNLSGVTNERSCHVVLTFEPTLGYDLLLTFQVGGGYNVQSLTDLCITNDRQAGAWMKASAVNAQTIAWGTSNQMA